MSYARGSHTVFQHRYHIVWITKYRYEVLEGALRERIYPAGAQRPGRPDRLRRFVARTCPYVGGNPAAYCGQRLRAARHRDAHHIGCRWSFSDSVNLGSNPGPSATELPDMTVYFQFPRAPELSRYVRALAFRRKHRRQPETLKPWIRGANGRRVSRGRFCLLNAPKNPVGCYELSRYGGDYDKMLEQILSIYKVRPDLVVP
jgi:hypothetical protein